MMSQSNFLSSLQSFPKDTINDEMVELLAPYLEMDDYNMETAKRVRWGMLFMPVSRFMETRLSRNNNILEPFGCRFAEMLPVCARGQIPCPFSLVSTRKCYL